MGRGLICPHRVWNGGVLWRRFILALLREGLASIKANRREWFEADETSGFARPFSPIIRGKIEIPDDSR